MPSIVEFANNGVGLIQQGLNREGIRASVCGVDIAIDQQSMSVVCTADAAVPTRGGGFDVLKVRAEFLRHELEHTSVDLAAFVMTVVARPMAAEIRRYLAENGGSPDGLPSGVRRLGEDVVWPGRRYLGGLIPRTVQEVWDEPEAPPPVAGKGTARPDDAPSWIGHQWSLDEQGRGACAACGRLRSELAGEAVDRCALVSAAGDVLRWYLDQAEAEEHGDEEGDEQDGRDEPADEVCECEQCRAGRKEPTATNPCGEVLLIHDEASPGSFEVSSSSLPRMLHAMSDTTRKFAMLSMLAADIERKDAEDRKRRDSQFDAAATAYPIAFPEMKKSFYKKLFGGGS